MEKIEIVLRRVEKDAVSEKVLVSHANMNTQQETEIPEVLNFPGLEICLREQIVIKDDMKISMSHYEFATLCFLAQKPGWVFSKKQIYEAVWQQPGENCGPSVSSVINQIRRKLNQKNPKEGYIKTVVGSGYKFEV